MCPLIYTQPTHLMVGTEKILATHTIYGAVNDIVSIFHLIKNQMSWLCPWTQNFQKNTFFPNFSSGRLRVKCLCDPGP